MARVAATLPSPILNVRLAVRLACCPPTISTSPASAPTFSDAEALSASVTSPRAENTPALRPPMMSSPTTTDSPAVMPAALPASIAAVVRTSPSFAKKAASSPTVMRAFTKRSPLDSTRRRPLAVSMTPLIVMSWSPNLWDVKKMSPSPKFRSGASTITFPAARMRMSSAASPERTVVVATPGATTPAPPASHTWRATSTVAAAAFPKVNPPTSKTAISPAAVSAAIRSTAVSIRLKRSPMPSAARIDRDAAVTSTSMSAAASVTEPPDSRTTFAPAALISERAMSPSAVRITSPVEVTGPPAVSTVPAAKPVWSSSSAKS